MQTSSVITRRPRRCASRDEASHLADGAVVGVDAPVVGDVVAVVATGRRVERQDPDRGDAQVDEVIQLLDEPPEVADAVPVRIAERAHVQLVDDRVLVPVGDRRRHLVRDASMAAGHLDGLPWVLGPAAGPERASTRDSARYGGRIPPLPSSAPPPDGSLGIGHPGESASRSSPTRSWQTPSRMARSHAVLTARSQRVHTEPRGSGHGPR